MLLPLTIFSFPFFFISNVTIGKKEKQNWANQWISYPNVLLGEKCFHRMNLFFNSVYRTDRLELFACTFFDWIIYTCVFACMSRWNIFDVFVIFCQRKKLASPYDFLILNNDKNKILILYKNVFFLNLCVLIRFFPFPPIIHEYVVILTLSMCTTERTNDKKKPMTIENESMGKKNDDKIETNEWRFNIYPYKKQNNWTISD